MSWMIGKMAGIICDEVISVDEREASAAASALLERSDELWEDVREHEPPVGENLLWLGPKGGMFLGKTLDGRAMNDGTVWVRSMNGCRKARFWMEAPKERVVA